MTRATAPDDLQRVHERLRAILEPCRDRLTFSKDGPDGVYLELPGYEGQPWGYVGGTRLGKRYVSYYLMGVYGDEALAASISPALRRRMQGKSCFNFTRIDEPLFAELAELTAADTRGFPVAPSSNRGAVIRGGSWARAGATRLGAEFLSWGVPRVRRRELHVALGPDVGRLVRGHQHRDCWLTRTAVR